MTKERRHEATNTSQLTNTLLNGNNNLSWAKAASRALSGREMREYITGENKKPEPINPNLLTEAKKKTTKKWRTENDKIITWLTNSMEPAISDLFLLPDTAFEFWEAVSAMYGQQNNYSLIYQLKQEIQQEKQGTRKHIEYLRALKRKKDELRMYRPPTTDLSIIRKREEEDDIFEYLAGLNPSYEAVRAQIMNTIPLPSYSQIQNMIQQEESRRETMSGPQVAYDEGHETHGFIAAKKSNFPNFSKFGQNPSSQIRTNSSEIERCTHCRKEGHSQERCWFLHPHLKPKHWKLKGSAGGNEERKKEGNGAAPHGGFSTATQSGPREKEKKLAGPTKPSPNGSGFNPFAGGSDSS